MDTALVFLVLATVATHTNGETIDQVLINALKQDHVKVQPVIEMEDGKFLYELDEELTPEQYQQIFAHNTTDKNGNRIQVRAAAVKTNRWPDAVFPYTMDSSFRGKYLDQLKKIMNLIQKDTCVKFTPRCNERNYVAFFNGGGCWSMLGMTGRGKQKLSLGVRGCRWDGTIYHEIMHALGIIHEQERPDRDEHVFIDYGNMMSGASSQFEKAKKGTIDYYNVPYDFSSLMHYGFTFFSKNKRKTIKPLSEPNADKYLGDTFRKGPSFGDVKLINRMYNCHKSCSNVRCSEPGFVSKECKCVKPSDFYREYCTGEETTGWCLKYKNENGRRGRG